MYCCPWEKMCCAAAAPCLGVAIVSNLYIHLVQARRQHREETGDVCRCPMRGDTLLPANEHDTVIVLASQVRTLDGENSMSYTKGDKNVNRSFPWRSLCHLSAKIISTCHLVHSPLFLKCTTDCPADEQVWLLCGCFCTVYYNYVRRHVQLRTEKKIKSTLHDRKTKINKETVITKGFHTLLDNGDNRVTCQLWTARTK